jgi:hypothetical protein
MCEPRSDSSYRAMCSTGPEQFEERKVQFYREKAEREAAAAAAAARKN